MNKEEEKHLKKEFSLRIKAFLRSHPYYSGEYVMGRLEEMNQFPEDREKFLLTQEG